MRRQTKGALLLAVGTPLAMVSVTALTWGLGMIVGAGLMTWGLGQFDLLGGVTR